MAVDLSTDPGGLFRRLGKLFGYASDVRTHQTDLVTETDDVGDQYNADRDIFVRLESALTGFIAAAGQPLNSIRAVAEQTVIDMVDDDDALPSRDLTTALQLLIDQMVSNSDSVDGTTVSANSAAGRDDGTSNVGNGSVIVDLEDREGNALANVRAEDMILVCTKDAQVSGTAGAEVFSIKGESTVDNLDRLWPQGSGINATITVINPAVNAGSGGRNMLTNSDFEDFTTDAPDNWDIDTGSAGTTIDDETTNFHRGAKALKFIGNGSELTKISQTFASGKIKPNTKYLLGFWTRTDGSVAAGAGRVSVQDSGGILTGASIVVLITSLTSSYALQTVVFETGEDIDTTHEIVIELTTAVTNTEEWLIDDLFMVEMQQFGGPGGPFIAIVPGDTDFVVGDQFTTTITNNNEGAFVRDCDRFFRMYEKGLLLPQDTGGSETIDDAWIS